MSPELMHQAGRLLGTSTPGAPFTGRCAHRKHGLCEVGAQPLLELTPGLPSRCPWQVLTCLCARVRACEAPSAHPASPQATAAPSSQPASPEGPCSCQDLRHSPSRTQEDRQAQALPLPQSPRPGKAKPLRPGHPSKHPLGTDASFLSPAPCPHLSRTTGRPAPRLPGAHGHPCRRSSRLQPSPHLQTRAWVQALPAPRDSAGTAAGQRSGPRAALCPAVWPWRAHPTLLLSLQRPGPQEGHSTTALLTAGTQTRGISVDCGTTLFESAESAPGSSQPDTLQPGS